MAPLPHVHRRVGPLRPLVAALAAATLLATAGAHSCYYNVVHVDGCRPASSAAGIDACQRCAAAHNALGQAPCNASAIASSCRGTLPPEPSGSRPMHLTLLNDSTGARCLDGSPGGYYHRPGVGDNATKWLLVLQGGGWCTSVEDCTSRAKTSKGSSKGWAPTTTQLGILSADPAVNPHFFSYTAVYLYYCDGFSFVGDAEAPVSGLYFRGRRILDGVLASLSATKGLDRATSVLLSGHSAGGLATYLHADHVGDVVGRLTAAGRSNGLVYGAAPDAGYFMNLAASREATTRLMVTLTNASGNDACLAAKPAADRWQCFFPENVFPFINSSTFVVNSLYDPYQLVDTLSLACSPPGTIECANGSHPARPTCNGSSMVTFQANRQDVLASMKAAGGVLDPGRAAGPCGAGGAFLPSCMCHTEMYYNFGHTGGTFNNDDWRIPGDTGIRLSDAIGRWWASLRPPGARDDDASAQGSSDHVYVDAIPWPGNRPCAQFGIPKL